MIVLGDGLYVDVTELSAKVKKLTVDCLGAVRCSILDECVS